MPKPPESADLLETIIGVAPGSAISQLRAQRPEIVRHTQGSHDVLLSPADPGGLSLAERALVARTRGGIVRPCGAGAHYRSLLAATWRSRRMTSGQRHDPGACGAPGRRRPATAPPGHIDTLARSG